MQYARHLPGVLTALKRWDSENTEKIGEVKSQIATRRIEAYIKKTVDYAPPLTQEQRDRISVLIQKIQPTNGMQE